MGSESGAVSRYLIRPSTSWDIDSEPISRNNCCGATVGNEQQHNQDLREIYKGGQIFEFITFYHNTWHLTTLHQNALHLTRVHCPTFYRNALRHEELK